MGRFTWESGVHYYFLDVVDYQASEAWDRQISVAGRNASLVVPQMIPVWCCKMTSTVKFPTPAYKDSNCLYSPTSSNSHIGSLCPEALLSATSESTLHILNIVVSILCPLLAALHLAVISFGLRALLCNRDEEYEGDTPIFDWDDNYDPYRSTLSSGFRDRGTALSLRQLGGYNRY